MADERYDGLDLLRGLAVFGIVGCHLGLSPLTAGARSLLHFTDTNVGVFGTVSGFLLALSLQTHWAGFGDFILRRARRLLVPYCLWTVIFVLATAIFDLVFDGRLNPSWRTGAHWFYVAFNGNGATHLWYLVYLFYFSVLFAPFHRFVRFAWLLFPLGFVCLYWAGYYPLEICYYGLRLLGFLLLGVGLFSVRPWLRRIPWWIWMFLLGGCLYWHFTHYFWYTKFCYDGLIACSLVGLFASTRFSQLKVCRWLGAVSMGVYLAHPLVAVALSLLVRKLFPSPYSAGIVATDWLFACMCSVALALGMQKMVRVMKNQD